jgi:hypothetical protein
MSFPVIPHIPPEPFEFIPIPQPAVLLPDPVVFQNPVFAAPSSQIPVPPFTPPPVAPVIAPVNVVPAPPPPSTEFPGGSEFPPPPGSAAPGAVRPSIVFPGTTTPTPTVYPAQNLPIPAP